MASFGLLGVVVASSSSHSPQSPERGGPGSAGHGRDPLSGIGVWRMTNSRLLTSVAATTWAIIALLRGTCRWAPRARAESATVAPPHHRPSQRRSEDLSERLARPAAGFDVEAFIGRGAPPSLWLPAFGSSRSARRARERSRMVLLPLRALREARRQKGRRVPHPDPELIPVGMALKLLGSGSSTMLARIYRAVRAKAYLPRPLRPAALAGAAVEWVVGRTFDGVVTGHDAHCGAASAGQDARHATRS